MVVSVVSTKGGVGKTTTAANLAGLLAELGQRVLIIDCDMQDGLSKVFPLQTQPTTGIGEVILRGGLIQPADIVRTDFGNLDLIASNLTDSTQSWLRDREDRLILLKRAVRQPVVSDNYDIVVIDTQGAKGQLQRTAAMAADIMLSPIQPSMMAYVEFSTGTLEMLNSLNLMSDVSPEFRAGQLRVLINAIDRTRDASALANVIRDTFRAHATISVLDVAIPQATTYREARTARRPVHQLSRPNIVRPGASAYEVMHALVHELLPHLKGLWVDGHRPFHDLDLSHAGSVIHGPVVPVGDDA